MEVIFTGRLGKDPELKTTKSNTQYYDFSVAMSEYRNGQESTSWFNCCAFNPQQFNLLSTMKKGSAVEVSGDLQIAAYIDKNQEAKINRSLIVHHIKYSNIGGSSSSATKQDDYNNIDCGGKIPQNYSKNNSEQKDEVTATSKATSSLPNDYIVNYEGEGDDLPF